MMTRQRAVEIREFVENTSQAPGGLPWQFFRRLRLRAAGRGELRLAAAVLEDAVRCLDRGKNGSFLDRMLRWEAEQWIRSADAGPLFSFERICALLDVKAGELRELLLNPRAKSKKSLIPATLEGPIPLDAVPRAGISLHRGLRRRN